MSSTTFASLLGGLGLFLLGMRMMTEGLKVAAGNALKSILESWTRTSLRGLLSGMLITAVVQSSSAVTVATVGFVNAGLLTLAQAVWVIFGTNVGTTMTGWLVALVGVKVDVGALALPLLGAGMLLRMAAGGNVRRGGFGEAAAGFGAFFLGIGILQGAFADLAPRLGEWQLASGGWAASAVFVGFGVLLTLLTQSSSAAIAISLTATAGGALPLDLAAAAVIGTNIGTTSTALLASIGATPPARRVASAHIVFNLLTGAVALLLLPLLLDASRVLIAIAGGDSGTIAVLAAFHTLFNVLGVLLMWPAAAWLVAFLSRRFVSAEEEIGRPVHLDPTLAGVPALALRGLVLELTRATEMACALASERIRGGRGEAAARVADRQRQEGLARLGRAIRGFIGELSAGQLPEDVVAPLPDLLRASQHVDDIGALSAELGPPPRASASAAASERWVERRQVLTDAVLDSLTLAAAGGERREALGEEVEDAYQVLKAELLKAGARGSLRVERMEEELLGARRLRRLATAALSARRRLEPWSPDSGPDAGAAAEVEARTSPMRPAPPAADHRRHSGSV